MGWNNCSVYGSGSLFLFFFVNSRLRYSNRRIVSEIRCGRERKDEREKKIGESRDACLSLRSVLFDSRIAYSLARLLPRRSWGVKPGRIHHYRCAAHSSWSGRCLGATEFIKLALRGFWVWIIKVLLCRSQRRPRRLATACGYSHIGKRNECGNDGCHGDRKKKWWM